MYNDTITLFNRYKGLNGDLFYPTVLRGVDLNMDKAAIIAKYGEQAADNARLHIKYTFLRPVIQELTVEDDGNGNVVITSSAITASDDGEGNVGIDIANASVSVADDEVSIDTSSQDGIEVGGKKYLPPKEWAALDEPATTITFDSGTDFDFFIVGEWEETDPIEDNDYLDGFYNYVNTRYDYVFAISSVARYSVIPHFEIMAR